MNTITTDNQLIHCIYTSVANQQYDHQEMVVLLDLIRTNNKKLNVTGMLLYDDGSFFQVLEGPRAAVTELFEHIHRDPRHSKVSKIIEEAIPERNFAEWTMGYSEVTAKELKKIKGLNDFLTDQPSFITLNKSRAQKLLTEFKQGRWRTRLE